MTLNRSGFANRARLFRRAFSKSTGIVAFIFGFSTGHPCTCPPQCIAPGVRGLGSAQALPSNSPLTPSSFLPSPSSILLPRAYLRWRSSEAPLHVGQEFAALRAVHRAAREPFPRRAVEQ